MLILALGGNDKFSSLERDDNLGGDNVDKRQGYKNPDGDTGSIKPVETPHNPRNAALQTRVEYVQE